MKLNEIRPASGSRKPGKRRGRGNGSGHGNFSGRGCKGQRARAGGKYTMPGFEGGQTPFWKKLPKRGFFNYTGRRFAWINLATLESGFEDGDEVTPTLLRQRGLVKRQGDGVKVLGAGKLTRKLTVHAHAFSAGARRQIERAGGKVVVLGAAAAGSEG